MNAAIRETWEQLHEWMDWAVEIPSLEESREKVRGMVAIVPERAAWSLHCFEKASGRFALSAGIHLRDAGVPLFEVGYWCRACFQKQGLVSEAVMAVTRFAFEEMGAERIEIRCDEANEPSSAGDPLERQVSESLSQQAWRVENAAGLCLDSGRLRLNTTGELEKAWLRRLGWRVDKVA